MINFVLPSTFFNHPITYQIKFVEYSLSRFIQCFCNIYGHEDSFVLSTVTSSPSEGSSSANEYSSATAKISDRCLFLPVMMRRDKTVQVNKFYFNINGILHNNIPVFFRSVQVSPGVHLATPRVECPLGDLVATL